MIVCAAAVAVPIPVIAVTVSFEPTVIVCAAAVPVPTAVTTVSPVPVEETSPVATLIAVPQVGTTSGVQENVRTSLSTVAPQDAAEPTLVTFGTEV